jgi:hypothetical protein
VPIDCLGDEHRMLWKNGSLAPLDHPDPEADRIGAALGHVATPVCIDPGAVWRRLMASDDPFPRQVLDAARRARSLGDTTPSGVLWDVGALPPVDLDRPATAMIRSAVAAARRHGMPGRSPLLREHVPTFRDRFARVTGVLDRHGLRAALRIWPDWPANLPSPEWATIDDTLVLDVVSPASTTPARVTAVRWDLDPSEPHQPALRASIGLADVIRSPTRSALRWLPPWSPHQHQRACDLDISSGPHHVAVELDVPNDGRHRLEPAGQR